MRVRLVGVSSAALVALACAGRRDVPPAPPAPAATTGPPATATARAPEAPKPPGSEERPEPAPPRPPGGPCAPDLARCPLEGCAAAGSPHALLNRLKRTTTTDGGTAIGFDGATPITVAQLRRLQKAADGALPAREDRELDAEQRAALSRFDLGDAIVGEGTAVRLAGYIAPSGRTKASGAHAGSEESVNCGLGGPDSVDFHIPLTASPDDDECHGVVVEMIPQGRQARSGWKLDALRDLAKKRRLVLVVGRLFYDNEHLVRGDCASPPFDQPKRASLWEVHPIVALYVCADQACTARSARGWEKIE